MGNARARRRDWIFVIDLRLEFYGFSINLRGNCVKSSGWHLDMPNWHIKFGRD